MISHARIGANGCSPDHFEEFVERYPQTPWRGLPSALGSNNQTR